MRDGVELAADLYFPKNASEKSPCVLMRNPAGRKAQPWLSLVGDLIDGGYMVAIQDTRNAVDPDGKTPPYLSDGWDLKQDGYDTVEWLAKSHYTNGLVGTVGFSAVGITQLMMAPSSPPSLRCQYIGHASASLYHHGIFPGGQLCKNQVENWLGFHAGDFGVLAHVCSQPFYNNFWKKLDTLSVADKVTVPAVHYGGWFDTFLQGTIEGFLSRQENGGEGAKGKQKLLIGPWAHFWPYDPTLGDFLVPAEGQKLPIEISPKRWFDFYLKKIPNGADEIPTVTYYVMGPFDGSKSSGNIWRHAKKWPVPSVASSFYLTADKTLSEQKVQKEDQIPFHYDPSSPVPTIGGRNLFLEQGPKDQRPIEERSDVLVFTTPPLDEDVEVTGQVLVKLFFSSTIADTDVAVRLSDVYPDKRSILIADGICRTGVSCRNNQDAIKEVEIDLWATSIVFAKGHQIRISVSGSNYPRYEKNANMGLIGSNKGKFLIAHNHIHLGKKYPSRLILPIVRRGNQWLASSE